MNRVKAMGMVLALAGASMATPPLRADERRVPVRFVGGHETDPRDRGRPVALVAGALGVEPEVFRDAFSRVHPVRAGAPSPEQARANKAALLGALAKYGITNGRLDEVSDHYRYRREEGETWPMRPAKAVAVVANGKVVRFEVVDPGEGYSSAPLVSVPGFAVDAAVRLEFGPKFERNGSVGAISLRTAR